jgi:steroid delta-isomerase-like uncharacterized protein
MATRTETQTDLMKRVGRRMIEIMNARKLDALDEIYAKDAEWSGPGGRELRGVEQIREMVSGYLTAFPDVRMTLERQVAEGDLLTTQWRAQGTHKGPLGEIPASGKKVDIRGLLISRFARGKVVDEVELFDELRMLKQIGVIES